MDHARTHHPYDSHIWWILHSRSTGQIGGCIGTPVAAKRYYFRFKAHSIFSIAIIILQIASDSHSKSGCHLAFQLLKTESSHRNATLGTGSLTKTTAFAMSLIDADYFVNSSFIIFRFQ